MRLFSGLFYFVLVLSFVSCTKKKSPVPIPADAIAITRINSKEIITQIAKEKLTDFSLDDLFSTSEEDTTQKKKGLEVLLEDPSEAGIDLLEDVWAFYRNSEIGIIASIQDADELEGAISQHITKNIVHSEKLSAFTGKKVSAVWSKEYVLFLISEKPIHEKYLFSLLSPERNLFSSAISEENEEKEVLVWNNNNYLRNFLPVPFQAIISSDSFSITSIDFQEGKVLVENKGLFNNSANFLTPRNFNPYLFQPDILVSIGISLNLSNIPFQEKEFTNDFLSQCFDGNVYARADSIRSLIKIFKTTEIDEEFNSVEKTDTLIEYYPSYLIYLPLKNKDSAQSLLNSLEKKGLLTKEVNDYKFTLTEYPVYFHFKNRALYVSDKKGEGLQGKESFFNTSLNSKSEYLLLKVNNADSEASKLNYLPQQLKNISLSAIPDSNNYIKIVGSIKTSQKEEYSLLTLINILKSKSTSFILETNETIQ